VAQDLTQGFFMELLERELLEKFDTKKKPAANLPARLRRQFCSNEEQGRAAAESAAEMYSTSRSILLAQKRNSARP